VNAKKGFSFIKKPSCHAGLLTPTRRYLPAGGHGTFFIHRDVAANLAIATGNRGIRSLFGRLRVANGGIGDVIGQLWLRFGSVCQGLFTLRLVMQGIRKMHRRLRYFLIRGGVVNQRVGDGLKRVRVRFKPYEEKVKKKLKRRFFVKKWHFE